MKPLIGITCAMGMQITSVNMRHMPPQMHQLNDAYMKAVALAGGIPVLIPVYEDLELVKDVIDRLDAPRSGSSGSSVWGCPEMLSTGSLLLNTARAELNCSLCLPI